MASDIAVEKEAHFTLIKLEGGARTSTSGDHSDVNAVIGARWYDELL